MQNFFAVLFSFNFRNGTSSIVETKVWFCWMFAFVLLQNCYFIFLKSKVLYLLSLHNFFLFSDSSSTPFIWSILLRQIYINLRPQNALIYDCEDFIYYYSNPFVLCCFLLCFAVFSLLFMLFVEFFLYFLKGFSGWEN